MASSGPNYPSTAVNDNTVGSRMWTDVTNVYTSNNVRASVVTGFPITTNYIKATNYGFSIPSGATIDGIEVVFEGYTSTFGGGTGAVSSVKLVKGGTIQGNNLSGGQSLGSSTDLTVTFGGATELWGLSFTDADINASDFGVAFSQTLNVGKFTTSAYCDTISIKVYYTESGGSGVNALLMAGD